MANPWTISDIPTMTGRVVMVTGGNSGMGLVMSEKLLEKGATVAIASRSLSKVEEKVKDLKAKHPSADVSGFALDLASFGSIKAFAGAFQARYKKLDVLINNAGLFCPPFAKTKDGFEVTVGVNHLGSFYLTQLLLPQLKAAGPSRIVFVSAGLADAASKVDLKDIGSCQATTSDMGQYTKSKQCSFVAAAELNRRLKAEGAAVDVFSVAPGVVATEIQGKATGLMGRFFGTLGAWMGQSVESGCKPALYAATAPALQGKGGSAYGPTSEMRGGPVKEWQPKSPALTDTELARQTYDETMRVVEQTVAKL